MDSYIKPSDGAIVPTDIKNNNLIEAWQYILSGLLF